MFNNLGKESDESVAGGINARAIPPEIYQTLVEKLDLSPRTLNALKRAKLNKIGEVLEKTDEDLFSIRNFGVKSLNELNDKLESFGYSRSQSSGEESPDDIDAREADDTEGEEKTDCETSGKSPQIRKTNRSKREFVTFFSD